VLYDWRLSVYGCVLLCVCEFLPDVFFILCVGVFVLCVSSGVNFFVRMCFCLCVCVCVCFWCLFLCASMAVAVSVGVCVCACVLYVRELCVCVSFCVCEFLC